MIVMVGTARSAYTMKTDLPACVPGAKSPKPIVKKNLRSVTFLDHLHVTEIQRISICPWLLSVAVQMRGYFDKMENKSANEPENHKHCKSSDHTFQVSPSFPFPIILAQFL